MRTIFAAVCCGEVDGTIGQVAFEFFECLFNFGELEVVFPKLGRVVPAQVGAKQVAPFAAAGLAQLLSVEAVGEGRGLLFAFAVDEDCHVDVTGIASGFLLRCAEGLVELVALDELGLLWQIGDGCTSRQLELE